MEAGKELDALVAEKVMGWKLLGEGPNALWMLPGDKVMGVEWSPSTDIAAAWEVLMAMKEKHVWRFHLNNWPYPPRLPDIMPQYKYTCIFTRFSYDPKKNEEVMEIADTAPLAICKAALAALRAVDAT